MRVRMLAAGGVAAVAVVLGGCITGIEEQVSVGLTSPNGAVNESRSTTFTATIIDRTRTEEEIAAATTWSVSGQTSGGLPIAELMPGSSTLERTVWGLHSGLAQVTASYRGRSVTSPLAVVAVTVRSITVPATLTVDIAATESVIPIFRDSVDASVHRHNATWTVENPSVAEVLAVAGSEPAEWQIRGKASGTTDVTVTSDQGTGTITVTVP